MQESAPIDQADTKGKSMPPNLKLAIPTIPRTAANRVITPPTRSAPILQSRINPDNLPVSSRQYNPFSTSFPVMPWDAINDPLSPILPVDEILPQLENLRLGDQLTYSAATSVGSFPSSVSVSPNKDMNPSDPRRNLISSTRHWFVVRMKNISWDISIQDIRAYFHPVKVNYLLRILRG